MQNDYALQFATVLKLGYHSLNFNLIYPVHKSCYFLKVTTSESILISYSCTL